MPQPARNRAYRFDFDQALTSLARAAAALFAPPGTDGVVCHSCAGTAGDYPICLNGLQPST